MRCPKCGTEIKETHKFCPKCGYAVTGNDNENKAENHMESKAKIKTKKDKKKRRTKIIACICAVSILISGTIGGLVFYFSLSTNDLDNKYICLDAGFTDVIIKSEDDAIKAAQSVAGILGITDAEKELKISNVNKVDDDTYYRMQQYYNDIPVYGRSVVIAADDMGQALTLTANTESISINYDYTKYISDDTENVIYITGSKPFVCNVNYIQQDGENLKTFSDVKSGKQIASLSMDYTVSENEYISENNGVFTVFDESRNLKVLNSNKKELLKTYDFNGKKVKRSFYTKGNENNTRDVENDKFLGYEAEYIINNNISFVSSENKAKLDENAIQLINNTEIAYDYYKEMFGRTGFDNMNSRMYISYNDKYDNGNNAYASAGSLLSFGYKYDVSQIDVVAHEYTHSVELTISSMIYEGESGAIMEAYSDIFGELIQAKATQSEPDWIMYPAKVNRNICEPSKSKTALPDTYKGEHWQTTENEKDKKGKSTNDYGHVHDNSTVISHAAYLMWNGSMKIDSDTLAKLWYRALFMLQSNATFSQCRNAVELSARIMVKNKQLTAEQYESVTKAFDAVGIDTAPYTYAKTVKNDFNLSVLSHEETENVNFNLTIYKMPVIKAGPNIKNNGMPKKVMEKTALSGKQQLHLEDGTYILELRDIADEKNQTQPITAKIVVNGKNEKSVDEVKIYTDFTDIITVVLNEQDDNLKSIPGKYLFTSGAGGWSTELIINKDYTFSGVYSDSELGLTGAKNPNGTVIICEFEGQLSVPEKVDNYTYKLSIKEISSKYEDGHVYYENGIEYVCTGQPYGIDDCREFYWYMQGRTTNDLPETLLSWIYGYDKNSGVLPYSIIRNTMSEFCFVKRDVVEDSNAATKNGKQLTNAYVDQLYREANKIYCDWLYHEKYIPDYKSDITVNNNITINGIPYYVVKNDNVKTMNDLINSFGKYFNDSAIESIINGSFAGNSARFIEQNNTLYQRPIGGIGDDFQSFIEAKVKTQLGNTAVIVVTFKGYGPLEKETWFDEMTMELVNGQWVFTQDFQYDY